ncbi:iron ABC transporter permease [Pasteurellaceae bacterium LIM206]|nr:iron ABC transporter permease [Pasteurellaceae bacterium LIM206]
MILLIFLVFGTALFALTVGTFPIGISKLLDILFSVNHADFNTTEQHVIWNVRLPRILTSLLAGAALALSGATLQGVFHNPLVDPHIIGVTSGAAFGGCLAILLGFSPAGLMLSTFSFGLLTLILVYFVAALMGKENRIVLILAGVILNGFFSALVSLIQYLSDNEEVLPSIVFWLLGSFTTANWSKLLLFAVPVLIGGYTLLRLRWFINLLSLGDTQAKMLGLSVGKIRWFTLSLCAVIVASQVAVSGSIGWIGLIIPHITRFLTGADHRRLLPVAMLLGAIFMLLVDTLARTLTAAEVPVGIITAIFGAPIFTLLSLKTFRRYQRENAHD